MSKYNSPNLVDTSPLLSLLVHVPLDFVNGLPTSGPDPADQFRSVEIEPFSLFVDWNFFFADFGVDG